MTDIENEARERLNEVRVERGRDRAWRYGDPRGASDTIETTCRLLEERNAALAERDTARAELEALQKKFDNHRREVSNALLHKGYEPNHPTFHRFILPAADPLYDALKEVVEMGRYDTAEQTALLREALSRRGLTVQEVG